MTYAGRLAELTDHGVSIRPDSPSDGRLRGGGLAALARDRRVFGVTTDPTISEQALADTAQYDSHVQDLGLRGVSPEEALRSMIGYDVRWACDVLRPVYNGTGGADGGVSLEVGPRVAHDTAKTVAEARSWQRLTTRPDVMIEIPATDAGGLEALPHVGADYEDVIRTLERDVVQKFVDSWTDLLADLQAVLFDETEHRSPMQPR